MFSPNTRSFSLYKTNVFFNSSLKTSHILCLHETYFNLETLRILSFINSTNYSSIKVYEQYSTMIIQHWHHMKHLPLWEPNILLQHSMKIQGKLFMSLLSINLQHCYFNIHHSSSKVFRFGANLLANNHNWRLQHWITIFVNLGLFRHFETVTSIRTWITSHRYWRML